MSMMDCPSHLEASSQSTAAVSSPLTTSTASTPLTRPAESSESIVAATVPSEESVAVTITTRLGTAPAPNEVGVPVPIRTGNTWRRQADGRIIGDWDFCGGG